MSPDPHSVLWFDDEHGTQRDAGLGPWLRVLQDEEKQGRLRLTRSRTVAEFASRLRERPAATNESASPRPAFALLILDVMLIEERATNYADLGYAEENVSPRSAGVQIAELIRSSNFDAGRPEWLQPYVSVPIILLSNAPSVPSLVRSKIGRSRMAGLSLVAKDLIRVPGQNRVEAVPAFRAAVAGSLREASP